MDFSWVNLELDKVADLLAERLAIGMSKCADNTGLTDTLNQYVTPALRNVGNAIGTGYGDSAATNYSEFLKNNPIAAPAHAGLIGAGVGGLAGLAGGMGDRYGRPASDALSGALLGGLTGLGGYAAYSGYKGNQKDPVNSIGDQLTDEQLQAMSNKHVKDISSDPLNATKKIVAGAGSVGYDALHAGAKALDRSPKALIGLGTLGAINATSDEFNKQKALYDPRARQGFLDYFKGRPGLDRLSDVFNQAQTEATAPNYRRGFGFKDIVGKLLDSPYKHVDDAGRINPIHRLGVEGVDAADVLPSEGILRGGQQALQEHMNSEFLRKTVLPQQEASRIAPMIEQMVQQAGGGPNGGGLPPALVSADKFLKAVSTPTSFGGMPITNADYNMAWQSLPSETKSLLLERGGMTPPVAPNLLSVPNPEQHIIGALENNLIHGDPAHLDALRTGLQTPTSRASILQELNTPQVAVNKYKIDPHEMMSPPFRGTPGFAEHMMNMPATEGGRFPLIKRLFKGNRYVNGGGRGLLTLGTLAGTLGAGWGVGPLLSGYSRDAGLQHMISELQKDPTNNGLLDKPQFIRSVRDDGYISNTSDAIDYLNRVVHGGKQVITMTPNRAWDIANSGIPNQGSSEDMKNLASKGWYAPGAPSYIPLLAAIHRVMPTDQAGIDKINALARQAGIAGPTPWSVQNPEDYSYLQKMILGAKK